MPDPAPPPVPVFDGHNDALQRVAERSGSGFRSFFERSDEGHLDLPRAREGGIVGGLFAAYAPSSEDIWGAAERTDDGYRVPLPAPLPRAAARDAVDAQLARLRRIERASDGAVRVCASAAQVRAAIEDGAFAAVPHLEGAEAIGEDLDALELLAAAGVRSIGPVWSRPNAFAHGVPFRFPSSPDTGPGLTEAGRELVRACEALGVMIDLSHLNEAGFRDVARLSSRPLVATHSNAWALCPSSRNLTDEQLEVVRDSGGLVGVNFATAFLRPDGRGGDEANAGTGLDAIADHLEHLLERLGPGGVALGSDFDGAGVPAALGDAAGLPRLLDALRARGWDEATLRRVACDNWLDALERAWS